MKHFLFFLVFGCNLLSAQRLIWMQITPGGSVVANIHPKLLIDPLAPAFSSDYRHTPHFDCNDSVFSHLNFHSPRYGDSEEDQNQSTCYDEIDFSYTYLFNNHEWVNSSDLYPLLRIPSGWLSWSDQGNGKWEFSSSQHGYICGNDKTGHFEKDHQIWQMDGGPPIRSIDRLDRNDLIQDRFDLTYTPFNKIESFTKTGYVREDSYVRQQTEWFYDDKQRDAVMINYAGPHRNFSEKTIAQFKQVLNEKIKTGKSKLTYLLDSIQVQELVIYNYGKFGIEQVNCYYHPEEYSPDITFYSDSVFYNAAGKIIRYVGGKNMSGDYAQLWYKYDKTSGLLAQTTGRNYSECADRGCDEMKIQQWFSYSNGRISSVTENIFDITYQYKNEKYVNPKPELQEKRVYTYRYKLEK